MLIKEMMVCFFLPISSFNKTFHNQIISGASLAHSICNNKSFARATVRKQNSIDASFVAKALSQKPLKCLKTLSCSAMQFLTEIECNAEQKTKSDTEAFLHIQSISGRRKIHNSHPLNAGSPIQCPVCLHFLSLLRSAAPCRPMHYDINNRTNCVSFRVSRHCDAHKFPFERLSTHICVCFATVSNWYRHKEWKREKYKRNHYRINAALFAKLHTLAHSRSHTKIRPPSPINKIT